MASYISNEYAQRAKLSTIWHAKCDAIKSKSYKSFETTWTRCGSALAWLLDSSTPTDCEVEAERLIDRWGQQAHDVASDLSAQETGGFFDEPGVGFWNDVANTINQKTRSSMSHRNGGLDNVETGGEGL